MATIVPLTTRIYADGQCILAFNGPAFRFVSWSILTGAGAVVPYTSFTDQYGRCFALYSPEGYIGIATIQASFGA